MANSDPQPIMTGARYVARQLTAPDRVELAIKEIEANVKERPGLVFDYAKSLIETTCKTILKEKGHTAENWKVQQLASFTMKAVVRVPDGHPDPTAAKKRMETVLSGLVGVVHGIGELRNLDGEVGHGQEADRVTLESCHAEFAARSADAVIKFLVEAHRNAQQADGAAPPLSYFEHPEFNDFVDEAHPEIQILTGQYKASEVLFQMDRQTYKDGLDEFLEAQATIDSP